MAYGHRAMARKQCVMWTSAGQALAYYMDAHCPGTLRSLLPHTSRRQSVRGPPSRYERCRATAGRRAGEQRRSGEGSSEVTSGRCTPRKSDNSRRHRQVEVSLPPKVLGASLPGPSRCSIVSVHRHGPQPLIRLPGLRRRNKARRHSDAAPDCRVRWACFVMDGEDRRTRTTSEGGLESESSRRRKILRKEGLG
ncbi:hypothetical protein BD414DRAFT_475202 [Trametes punicea]|nr:hypothetical protein BD414DRAFT_475202 [Trametes punicea]